MNNKRKEEIKKIVEASGQEIDLLDPLIEDVVFLEGKLKELKDYPFIDVNPKKPTQQRTTPAGKQYKELLQQYINCIKVIISAIGSENIEEDSPLRKWVKGKFG